MKLISFSSGLAAVVLMLATGCISTSHSREQSSREVSDHKIAETTDLSRAFDTTDADELKIAEESMTTIDDQYADEDFAYPVSDIDAQNLLVCVREIVERRLGGLAGTRQAAAFLVTLNARLEVEQSVREVLAECESYRKQASVDPIDRNEQARYIAKLRTSAGAVPIKAKITLYRFVKPTSTCYAIGMIADAGLLAAVGGDAGFEMCSANNGRRWIQMALEGRAGYGAGGVALLKLGRYRYRMNYLGGPFTYTKTRDKKWAVGFGMTTKEMGEDYQHRHKGIIFVLPSKRANRNILGLGIGYFKQWGMRGGFKFLPLGTNKKGMLKEFRSLSRQDLFAEEASLQHVLSDQGSYLLRVSPSESSSEPKVKFSLCNRETDECGDLFGGKYFVVEKMQANLRLLQNATKQLEGTQRSDSIKTALYSTLALSFAGTAVVRRALNSITTEGEVTSSIWKGTKGYEAPQPKDRGIKWFKFWEPLDDLLQKAANSKPMLAIRDLATKISNVWDNMFNKAPKYISSNFFRIGTPVAAVAVGGVMAMISAVKSERGEILVRTYHDITDKQKQVMETLPHQDSDIFISAGSKDDFIRALRALTVGAE
ncbi:MAG: hypothetical protein OYH77_01790 [Pseudomonadota bacterium]|nr:hypothetical protein [Pseudomonadota bacterium]